MPLPLELSVQLYSLRRMPDLGDQLRLVSDAGLTAVEATSSNYEAADRMATICGALGLVVPSGHVGLDRLRSRLDDTIAIARALGIRILVLWGLPEDETPRSAESWRKAGAELGRFADRLAARELSLAFHNHDWELQPFEGGRIGLDLLFEGAGGAPLFWQADLAWLARGGADVEAMLGRNAARLVSAHVKDMAPQGTDEEDGWADLGHGVLPWQEWWKLLRDRNIGPLVLEHDEPSDPVRFLSRSVAAAARLEAAVA